MSRGARSADARTRARRTHLRNDSFDHTNENLDGPAEEDAESVSVSGSPFFLTGLGAVHNPIPRPCIRFRPKFMPQMFGAVSAIPRC